MRPAGDAAVLLVGSLHYLSSFKNIALRCLFVSTCLTRDISLGIPHVAAPLLLFSIAASCRVGTWPALVRSCTLPCYGAMLLLQVWACG